MLNFESEDEMPKLATLQTQLQLLHTYIHFGSFTARFKNHVSIVSRVSYGTCKETIYVVAKNR